MSDEITNINDIITRTFKNLSIDKLNTSSNINSEWEKILLRIKSKINENEGANLASHSRVIDLKNGILLVEADHPGWIELLRLHQKYIIKGLNLKFPELKIENLAFKLKGKKAEIFDNSTIEEKNKETKRMIFERIEKEEKINKKLNLPSVKTEKNIELPQELASVFEELKKDMLTNQKN